MWQKNENWVHLFEMINTGKHKNGFTLYEIVSMVYPKVCPEAITKIIVWKRYNDFKNLYYDIKKKQKKFQIKEDFPKFIKTSYFNRFTEQVIDERRKFAQVLLEYIAKYPSLYMSDVFINFFKTSYTPTHQLKGCIDEIRDDLQIPNAGDIISVDSCSSDEDKTIYNSETDSLSTHSTTSISIHSQITDINSTDSLNLKFESIDVDIVKQNKYLSEPALPSIPETCSDILDAGSILNYIKITDNPETMYLFKAAKHISNATDFEIKKDYENAFMSYKQGISCLLNGVHDDPDIERRQNVKYKTVKYLLKAEKIYNIHLNTTNEYNWNDKVSQELENCLKIERPLHELNKMKVVGILNSVILIKNDDTKDLFVVKVIKKLCSATVLKKTPTMPTNVPFMVQMYQYFCTDDAIYVVLQYASGGKLWDYLYQYKDNSTSKCSTPTNTVTFNDKTKSVENIEEKILSDKKISSVEIIENKHTGECEVDDLVQNAQKLLHSISEVLNESRKNTEETYTSNPDSEISDMVDVKQEEDPFNIFEESQSVEMDDWSENIVKQWDILPEQIIKKWAAQLLIALEYLQHLGVKCYELHPDNLLLDENNDLLLTFMYHWEGNETLRYSNKHPYVAPELNTIYEINGSVIWWSYGTILYEMLTGLNFYKCHPGGFHNYSILNIPKYISFEAHSLLSQLLTFYPEQRLDDTTIIKSHPFFNSINWETVIRK